MSEDAFISSDGNEVFQAKYIPKQRAPPSADHPSMKAFLSTYPALGQVTTVSQETITFTALLEVDESRAKDPWEASLWYAVGDQWTEAAFEPLESNTAHPVSLQKSNGHGQKLYFATAVAIQRPTTFTLKFRNGPDQSWKWVKDHQGTEDGVVMLKMAALTESISSNLEEYVQELNPILETKNYRSQCPGTMLWSVEAPIEAAKGDESTFKDIKFGLPWGEGKFSR